MKPMRHNHLFTIMLLITTLCLPCPLWAGGSEEVFIVPKHVPDVGTQYHPLEGRRAFVWKLQHANSTDVFDTLQNYFASEAGGVPPVQDDSGSNLYNSNSNVFTRSGSAQFTIVDDVTNNSILVHFKDEQAQPLCADIIELLRQLDRRPHQILIEVLAAEVKLTTQDEIRGNASLSGYHAFNRPGMDSITEVDNGLLQQSETVDQGRSILNGYKLSIEKTDRIRGFIQGLMKEDNMQVVSSPKIIATNNTPARLEITRNIPYISSQSVDATSKLITRTWSSFPSQISLYVTARIGRGGSIILDLTQNIDELSDVNANNGVISKTGRSIHTNLILNSHQTVVLGGFLKESIIKQRSGVPLLQDLPLLGKLFQTWESRKEKTELLLFVTPKLIISEEDGNHATRIIEQNLKRPERIKDKLRQIVSVSQPADDETVLVARSSWGWRTHGYDKGIARILSSLPEKIDLMKEKADQSQRIATPCGYGPSFAGRNVFATVLPKDNGYFFYRNFQVDDPSALDALILRVASDNASVIYINNQRVDVDPLIHSANGHEWNYWNRDLEVDANLLVNGENTVVVLVKNDRNSSDAFFDMEIAARVPEKKQNKAKKSIRINRQASTSVPATPGHAVEIRKSQKATVPTTDPEARQKRFEEIKRRYLSAG